MKKFIFLTFLNFSFFVLSSSGQDILMHNGTLSMCTGNFYDSGSDTSNYHANENEVLTICSDVPGMCVSLQFSSFNLENNFDFLYVYNGPSSASPLLGTFTGNTLPGTITATSGCLTIKFVSDYTVNKSGWAAIISCSQCPVNGCPTCNGGQPPANDACSGTQNLGALPLPAACPSGMGQVVTFNTTNLCATAEIPYNALQGCNPVGNMATPASDVWYKFTITGPILNIIINGMITPEVGLYSGSGCNNLVPRGCAIGGGGYLNTTFSGLAPGQYFLRVSGGTLSDQCNFSLSLQNNLDCQGCVIQSSLTVNPPPQNGIYLAGQTVNFCLNITGFSPASANWLHAVIPSFGPGWDLSTLTTSSPVSCSGNGNWNWYNQTVTSTANGGFSAGPGFFYETAAGNSSGAVDADPGNNFGDNLTNGCSWNFCFSIHTKDQANCNSGENLNVFIDTYGDGETGSWTSVACAADPVNDFYAGLACCIPPTVAVTNPLCNGGIGAAVGTGLGSGPWTYQWKNSAGTVIQQITTAGTNSIANLTPGTYTLSTTDNTGCESVVVFVIANPQLLGATVVVNDTKCANNNGVISITSSGGTSPYTYSKNNGTNFQAGSTFTNLAPGIYPIVVKDSHGCLWDTTVTIAPSTLPIISNITTQDITCHNGNDGTIDITAGSGIAPYNFSISGGGSYQSSSHFDLLPAGTYQVVVSDVKGCTVQTSVVLNQPPPVDLDITTTDAACGDNDGTITLDLLSGGSGSITYSVTGGLNFQTSNYFDSLAPGVYIVVIQDVNGCLTQDTAIINNLNAPVIDSVVTTNLTCYHSQDGNIIIYASGGSGPIQYSINGGNSFFSSDTFPNVMAKSFTIIVKDPSGCLATKIVVVTEPPKIVINGDLTPTSCGLDNGIISLHTDNGVLPLQYSNDSGLTWQSSGIFYNLPAGNVTFMVQDSTGCQSIRTYNFPASTAPSISTLAATDVSCFNAATGTVLITTVDGTPPIQYSIDGGINFSSINNYSGLVPGNYPVVVQDNAGCLDTSAFTVGQPAQVQMLVNTVDGQCGTGNGSITINASGGTGVYSYSIDGGASFVAGNVFNNLAAGNYKVVTIDANACVIATTVDIIDEPGPRFTNVVTTPEICDGINNGSVSLTAVSGTGALQYSMDSGSTYLANSNFLNVFAGNYYLYVQDANGCKDSALAVVGIYHSPIINLSTSVDASCFGSSNGTITIAASGGNGSLSYSINNGIAYSPANNFGPLNTGTYYLVVQDTNLCKARDTVIIAQPTPLNFTTTLQSEKCHRNDGALLIHPSGGTPGYLFSIDNGIFVNDSNFTSLDSGAYHIVISDANGCLDSLNSVVPFSPAPHFNAIAVSNETCVSFDNGSISINAGGGSGILQYSIDNGFSYQSTQFFDSLASSTYSLIVLDTNNCSVDSTVAITQPQPFVFNYLSVPSNCNFSNGSFTVNVFGGTGALTYSINQINFSANTLFGNLSSGNYTVTVKDAAGCTEDFVASISNLNGPSVQNINTTDLTCNGMPTGTIAISASGGSGSLSYSINNGTSFSTVNNYTSLAAGIYNIVVKDTAGCDASNSVIIAEPDAIVINQQVVPAACGQSNGSVTLNVTGGTGVYSYSIDSINYQPSPVFNNLIAGNYSIVVHDANNCVSMQPVNINNLLAPLINAVQVTDLSCNNNQSGLLTITASGGTGNLAYSIDNGITYQSSNIFSSLTAGTYSIAISDINNCISNTVATINEPAPLVLSQSVINETCGNGNGNISINANGGSSPYLYSIDSGTVFSSAGSYASLANGLYHLVIKDVHGCKTYQQTSIVNLAGPQINGYSSTNVSCHGGSDGSITINSSPGNGLSIFALTGFSVQSSNLFSGLLQGSYVATVSDTNACQDTIHITITQPLQLAVSKSSGDPLCFGSNDGIINITPSGGTPVYAIQWSNGLPGNFVANNLSSGIYYFTVTDLHSCVLNDSLILNQPDSISVTSITANASCPGSANGTSTVSVIGGTAPYSYYWANGISNTNYINNVSSGTYSLTVTDAQGCLKYYSVSITEPGSISTQIQTIDANCFGDNNGSITVSTSGGTSPYSFSWNGMTNTDSTVNNLAAGTYTVTVTDLNGCTLQESIIINAPSQLALNGIITDVSCNGYTNGSVSVNASGGIPSYAYLWSNGTVQSSASNLPAGNYTVTVTDNHLCTHQVSYVVAEPAAILLLVTPFDTLCIGQSTTLYCNVSGGSGSYIYTWYNGLQSSYITVSPAVTSTYTVQAMDNNGCLSAVDTSFIFVYPPLQITVSANDTICEGETVILVSSASGGNGGPYFYNWTPNNAVTSQINVQPAITTNYVAVITDNCTVQSVSASTQILVNPLPKVDFDIVPSEGCVPLNVDFINQSSTPNGSVYQWNLGDGSPVQSAINPFYQYTTSGNYDVSLVITTPENCVDSLIKPNAVHVYELPQAAFTVTPPTASILDAQISFIDNSYLGAYWNWSFGNGQGTSSLQNPQYVYNDTGTYTVQLIIGSEHLCFDTIYHEVIITGAYTLYIPNAFTPNGDGKNDYFGAQGYGNTEMSIQIYNRWGNKIFDSSSVYAQWNGKDQMNGEDCPQGVYIYKLTARDFKNKPHTYEGRVTLVR